MERSLSAGDHIGRFRIVRELGRGAQGIVYLVHDTLLERPAALKWWRASTDASALHAEARIVSTLQHPNIVTLYDVVEEAGAHGLVFEYVEGQTLAQLLQRQGSCSAAQAVRLVLGLLGGIACAHAQGVVHRDLKPSNVMLTASGVPRIMDFGVATRVQQRGGDELLYGTPSYMAPEYVGGAPYTPACDLFSLGMLLYELLVGAPAVRERDPAATLRRMRVGLWPRPSERVAGIDARLDRLVMQAIAAEPAERYADAATFAAALGEYLDPVPSRGEDDGARSKQATLDFLLRRMRHGSDFPALSATIGSVNQALAAENERASVLCNTILKDFALTNKLLKLVNAAHYNSFGGRVSTVSRAVAILGFDGVRNVALSLVLLEHLQNKSQAAALREEVGATYFRGVIARQLGRQLGAHEAESLFICAMFHRLGKLLAMFYLHEEAQAIVRLCEARGIDEMRASAEVLGISYEELGIGVAREWKFPDLIIDSMRHVANPLRGRAVPASERQRVLSAVADEAYDISLLPQDRREAALTLLARKFDCGLGISEKALRTAMNEAATEVSRDAALLGMSVAHPRTPIAGHPGQMAIADAAHANSFDAMVADATLVGEAGAAAPEERASVAEVRRSVLTAGVQDITNTLVGDYELNDVLRIILETMYRAIGFKRVMLLVRDPRAAVLRARFGFGDDVAEILRKGFAVPLAGPRDIFYAAISQGADLCIENLGAEKIRPHVPQWYQDLAAAYGLVLFPVLVNHRPVALIYADADTPETLHFQPEELNLLKTLRNQAVLAIKQRS